MTSALHAPRHQLRLGLEAGKVVGLVGSPGFGLTRLGLGLLRGQPGWVACVDVRGWLSPAALWEVGVSPERVVIVRCSDPRRWSQVNHNPFLVERVEECEYVHATTANFVTVDFADIGDTLATVDQLNGV